MYTEAKANNADIIGCDFIEEEINSQTIRRQKLDYSVDQIFVDILKDENYPNVWSRLINRKLIEDSHVEFVSGIRNGEDLLYFIPLLLKATKISYIQEPFYHYRMVSNSISHTSSLRNINSIVNVFLGLKEYVIGKEEIYQAWKLVLCRKAQPLITQPEFYNPEIWRKKIGGISNPYFGSLKTRISPWLVLHHLDALNLLIIKLYRIIVK